MKELAVIPSGKGFGREQVDLIKQTVAKGATDTELKLFLYQAEKSGLDPLARQIYFQKRRNYKTGEDTVTILTGIDGYRVIANRTGQYAGNDDPVFDNEEKPAKATVTVYRLVGGVRCGFTATARWDQYYPGEKQGFMWGKMPHLMLGKCAEALALRKAFPAELSGLYVKEEMDQAGPALESKPGPDVTEGIFDSVPEIYAGTDAHKQLLREAAKKVGITPKDAGQLLPQIHDACLKNQVQISLLENAVREFMSETSAARLS